MSNGASQSSPFRLYTLADEKAKREREAARTTQHIPQERPVARPTQMGLGQGSFPQASVVRHAQALETLGTLIEAYTKVAQRWGLSEDEQVLLLGYGGGRSVGRGLLSGEIKLPSQDLNDRIGYVLGISVGLGSLFREAIQPELDWLALPRKELGGESARQRMLSGRMRDLLAVHYLVLRERNLA